MEDAAAADAEVDALESQHDGAVVIGDGEVAAGEAHGLLGHRQRHCPRRAESRRHHRHLRRRHRGPRIPVARLQQRSMDFMAAEVYMPSYGVSVSS